MGSGEMLLWSEQEVILGAVFSLVVSGISFKLVSWDFSNKALDPRRWICFMFYLFGPFLFQLAKANLDVAYRVITGRINPGIVKVKTGLKSDLATVTLANSITLTPGTLTVDLNKKNDLYVHCLNVPEKVEPGSVYGDLGEWVRRVFE